MGWLQLVLLCLISPIVVSANTCSWVKSNTNVESFRLPQLNYTQEQAKYWSAGCSALEPSCILYPKTPREVSSIVHILNQNEDYFAVKSGGHNPNEYFSSIRGGPLISTKMLRQVELDNKTGRVRVGPGNRWDDVAEALDGTGWTVVGGRVGNVGVGGYMVGGGLSFLSQQYGWAVSSIIEIEVVLANGTIVTTSSTTHPDLFKVLKGGGNNFGIVTSYLLQGYKQNPQIWGGTLVFVHSEETDAKLLSALQDFTQNNKDDRAAIILTAERAVFGLLDIWIMFVFYDGPTPPEGTFDKFTEANPTVNSAKTRSYYDLLNANNAFVTKGIIYTMGTETIPLPDEKHSARVFGDLHQQWRNISGPIIGSVAGAIAVQAYQPFPKRMARISRHKSSDLIDLDDEVDRIIIELNYGCLFKWDTERVGNAMEATINGIRSRVLEWQDDGVIERDVYLPLFMNDGYHSQDYFSRLRPENHKLAETVAKEVDPQGLFRERTGGFKP